MLLNTRYSVIVTTYKPLYRTHERVDSLRSHVTYDYMWIT